MNRSQSLGAFSACSHFVVHVLAAAQTDLARRFATPGVADNFADTPWLAGPGGAALLAGALAQFVCRGHRQHDGGDHRLFIGQVEAFHHAPGEPAVFHRGRFTALTA